MVLKSLLTSIMWERSLIREMTERGMDKNDYFKIYCITLVDTMSRSEDGKALRCIDCSVWTMRRLPTNLMCGV
jgi:hypothetical protein